VIDGQITPAASPTKNLDRASASADPSPPIVLLLWLAAQLAAIALAALRVPLWARSPISIELYALQYLLVAQFLVSALTFPWLLRNWPSLICALATGWGFLFLSMLLSPGTISMAILASLHLGIWLIALFAYSFPLHPTDTDFRAIAIVSTWVCGGPIWLFLDFEYYSSHSAPRFFTEIARGPLLAGFAICEGRPVPALATALLALALSLAFAIISRVFRAKKR